MTGIPDGLPTLSAGGHFPEQGEACVMEYVSVIAGEYFSDSPQCTNSSIACVARIINDYLTDEDRHMLVPYIHRLASASDTSVEFALALVHRFSLRNSDSWGLQAALKRKAISTIGHHTKKAAFRDRQLPYNPTAGVAFLGEILDIYEEVCGKPREMSTEALAKARELIESRNYVPSV